MFTAGHVNKVVPTIKRACHPRDIPGRRHDVQGQGTAVRGDRFQMFAAPRVEPPFPIGRRIELAYKQPDVAQVLEFGHAEGRILDDTRCQQRERVLVGQRVQPRPGDRLRPRPAPKASLVNGVGGRRPEGVVEVDVDRPAGNSDGVVVASPAPVAERGEHSTSALRVPAHDEQVDVVLGPAGEIAVQLLGEDRAFEEENGDPDGFQGVADEDEGLEKLCRRRPRSAMHVVDDSLDVARVDATSTSRSERSAHERPKLEAVQGGRQVDPTAAGRPQRIDQAISVIAGCQARDLGARFESGDAVVSHGAMPVEAIGLDRRAWPPGAAVVRGEGRECAKSWP